MTDVDEVKHRLDIVEFISHYVTLKKAGSNYKGLCPFHQEKTPSFMVSPEKQIFKCFGCGVGGSIFDFLMEYEKLDFREALEILAEKAGVQLRQQSQISNLSPRFAGEAGKSQNFGKSEIYQLNMAAAQLWHKILTKHPVGKPAFDYLRSRKIADAAIKKFLLGYASSGETTRVYLAKKGFSTEQIKAAGAPDKFFRRIIFPLFDVLGSVAAFTGRALEPNQEPKYLNTPETSLFRKSRYVYGLNFAKQAIKSKDRVIVVEGQMDVLASHQAEVANVVATSGTALTADHLKILGRYTDNIVLAFDTDEAGVKATKAALDLALADELNVRIAALPQDYKDVGEIVEKDPALWQRLASKALPWPEWFIRNAQLTINNYQLTPEGKKKIAKEVLPFLARVKDPIEQSHWVKKLSEILSVSQQAVAEALGRYGRNAKVAPAFAKASAGKQAALSPKEELYGLLTAFPQHQKAYPDLYKTLKNWYDKDAKLLEFQVQKLYEKAKAQDIELAVNQLNDRIISDKRQKIKSEFAQKIAEAESQGDLVGVKRLFAKLQRALKNDQAYTSSL